MTVPGLDPLTAGPTVGAARRAARAHPRFSGWTMLGVSGVSLLLSGAAQTYGIAVFVDPMLAEFGWSRSLISSAYAIATLVGAGAVVLAGPLIDRHGHRAVMAVTSLLFALALLLMGAVANPLTLVLGLALLRASGASVLSLAARTLASQWFIRRRGRAVGLINIGKMLGMGLVPLVSALLIEWLGWRNAWRINALIVGLVLVPATALLVRGRPEQLGQHPDGQPLHLATAGGATPLAETASTLRQALHTRVFWLLLGASAAPALVTNGLSFSQVSIFTDRGLDPALAATIFAIESGVALPVTLLAGWLCDRVAPRYVLALGLATLALAMVLLALTTSVAAALAYGVIRGVSTGTWILAAEVAWPAAFGRRHLGSIQGVNFAVLFVGAALGPLPFALLYDARGRYDEALWALALLPLLAAWAALLAKR